MRTAKFPVVTRKLCCCVFFALTTLGVLAQPAPVEILLIAPPQDLYVVQPVTPDWQAPSLPCHLCAEDKIDGSCGCLRPLTQQLAEQLYQSLDGLVAKAFTGKLALIRPARVKVVSADHLKGLAGKPAQGLYEEGVIYLSAELNRREGLAVLGHEYGHAWQYQHRQDIDRVEGLLFEGFAEWVSFHILAQVGDQKGTDDAMQDPSEYGRGARWYLALEKKKGMNAALECARYRLRK